MKPNEANKPRGRAAKAVFVAAAVVAIGTVATPAFADTITNPGTASSLSSPLILSGPITFSGTTSTTVGAQGPMQSLDTSTAGPNPRRPYCTDTTDTDPTSRGYGLPPVDASGNWTCTLGDPPATPQNGYTYLAASSLQPGTTYTFDTALDGSTQSYSWAAGGNSVYFQIAPTQAGPVIGSWEVAAGGALVAGGVALLVRRRRKAGSVA